MQDLVAYFCQGRQRLPVVAGNVGGMVGMQGYFAQLIVQESFGYPFCVGSGMSPELGGGDVPGLGRVGRGVVSPGGQIVGFFAAGAGTDYPSPVFQATQGTDDLPAVNGGSNLVISCWESGTSPLQMRYCRAMSR